MPRRRTAGDPWRILLVEDNPGDAGLTRVALEETGEDVRLDVVTDGEQALANLTRQGGFADAPTPDVILLDLNLPLKDGREVLADIKSDPALRRIPVGILSTSSAEQDIQTCYDRHANWYMTKPVGLADFIDSMRRFADHWFHTVVLPSRR